MKNWLFHMVITLREKKYQWSSRGIGGVLHELVNMLYLHLWDLTAFYGKKRKLTLVKSVFHVAGSMYLQRLRNVSVEKKREQCDPTLFMYLTKN